MTSTVSKAQEVPNFFHAESGQYLIHVASAICLPIILLFAALRFYSKLGLKRKLTWDDLTCTLGILSGLIFTIMCLVGVAPVETFTKTIHLRKRDMSVGQLRLTLVLEALYGPFVWFIKLSLFVVIVEIFSRLRWLKNLAIGGAVFTGLFYFATMIATPVLCAPRNGTSKADYIGKLGDKQCKGSFKLGIIVQLVSVLSDLYLVLLPLPAVWNLHMPLRRKFAIAAMFLVGIIALVASTVSLVYRIKVSLKQDDVCAFNILPNWLFAIIEMAAGISVTCMPAALMVVNRVKPVAKSIFSSVRSRTLSARSSSRESTQVLGKAKSLDSSSSSDSEDGYREKGGLSAGEKGLPARPLPTYAQWAGSESLMWDLSRENSWERSDVERGCFGGAGRADGGEITALPDPEAQDRREGILKTSHLMVEYTQRQ